MYPSCLTVAYFIMGLQVPGKLKSTSLLLLSVVPLPTFWTKNGQTNLLPSTFGSSLSSPSSIVDCSRVVFQMYFIFWDDAFVVKKYDTQIYMDMGLPIHGLSAAEYFWSPVSHGMPTRSMNLYFEGHHWNILQENTISNSGT